MMDGEIAYKLSRDYAREFGSDVWPEWEELGAAKQLHWEQMALEKGLTDRTETANVPDDERISR